MEVKLVKKLIGLSSGNFWLLKDFIDELKEDSRRYNDVFFLDFEKIIKKELLKKKFSLFKPSYYYLINKYRKLLEELGEEILEIRFMLIHESLDLSKIINYLYEHYDSKNIILNNLENLENLKIYNFEFIASLENDLEITFQKSKDNYTINSFYADGEKKYLLTNNGYKASIKNHNYIIKYIKNDIKGLISIKMYFTNLEFDYNTLPTYLELHDVLIWQYFDEENIILRSEALDNLNELQLNNKSLDDLYFHLNENLSQICFLHHDKDYQTILGKLDVLKDISKLLINLIDKSKDSYIKTDLLTEEEIVKYIKK